MEDKAVEVDRVVEADKVVVVDRVVVVDYLLLELFSTALLTLINMVRKAILYQYLHYIISPLKTEEPVQKKK